MAIPGKFGPLVLPPQGCRTQRRAAPGHSRRRQFDGHVLGYGLAAFTLRHEDRRRLRRVAVGRGVDRVLGVGRSTVDAETATRPVGAAGVAGALEHLVQARCGHVNLRAADWRPRHAALRRRLDSHRPRCNPRPAGASEREPACEYEHRARHALVGQFVHPFCSASRASSFRRTSVSILCAAAGSEGLFDSPSRSS